jgi:ribosomal protein S18 acetylase RimI-like enzyme
VPDQDPGDRPGVGAELHVRRATAADVPGLAAFAARAFTAAFGGDNDPDDLRRYVDAAFAPEQVAAELASDDAVVLVAHDGGATDALVGYAHLQVAARAEVEGRRQIQLVRLYVEPSAIGAGRGGALLERCLRAAAALDRDAIWLGVWEHNTRAVRFYERWGFRTVGTVGFRLGTELQTDLVMARAVP